VFFQSDKVDTRVSVLEEKMTNSENRMSKLDSAIQALSEISQNISRMLAIHEERIEQQNRTDTDIGHKIKELERKNSEDHEKVILKFDHLEQTISTKFKEADETRDTMVGNLNTKITKLTNVRMIAIGVGVAILFAINRPQIIIDFLTPDPPSPTMNSSK
jgi:predicted  nucleic acid-binding Zn-ribbon protein